MYKVFLFFLVALSNISFAQPIKLTDSTSFKSTDSTSIEDILVEIAWNHYSGYEIAEREIIKSRNERTIARLRWTSNLRVFYNFNDQIIENNATYSRPIYGLGLGLSVGDIFTLPAHTKIAKQNTKIAIENLKSEKLRIKAEVLRRYYNYTLSMELLKIRIQAYEDANSSYQITTKQFKEGKATLSQVDDTGRLMYKTMEEKLTMETQVKINKSSLEEMLTMTLEEALGTVITK